MIKFFNLQKNKYKKTETMPDYKISVNLGDEQSNFVEAGACWIKKNKNGETFLSCKLSDAYADHTKGVARKGFSLAMDGQTEVVKTYEEKPEIDESEDDGIPF